MNRRSLFNFVRSGSLFAPKDEPKPEPEDELLIDRKHSRRFFFGILAGAAATVAIPETGISLRLIWRWDPVSGNTLITTEEFTRTAREAFHRNMVMARNINRQFAAEFEGPGEKIGHVLNVRTPMRFRVSVP